MNQSAAAETQPVSMKLMKSFNRVQQGALESEPVAVC